MDYLSYIVVIEELAKVDASHAITVSAHTTLGTSPIVDVLDYPQPVRRPGLNLLCTPGNDVESTTAMAGRMISAKIPLTPIRNPAAPSQIRIQPRSCMPDSSGSSPSRPRCCFRWPTKIKTAIPARLNTLRFVRL
jgi:hypothetical protein